MRSIPTTSEIKRKCLPILKRSGVRRSELFGSFARGEAKKNSDMDLLVELPSRASLFDLIQLRQDLEEKLGRKVDVVSYRSVSPRLKPYVMKDVVCIL